MSEIYKGIHTAEYWKECYVTILNEYMTIVNKANSIKTQVAAAIIELDKEDQAWSEIWGLLPITEAEFIEGKTRAAHHRQSAIKILEGLEG